MSKKDLERQWLERARDLRPELFAGEILPGEVPDFVLVEAGIRKGVEVTRYVTSRRVGEPIGEEQNGLRRKVLRLSRNRFSQASSTRLRVGAVFRPVPPIRADRVSPLVQAISDYLVAHGDGTEWARVEWRANDDNSVPPELLSLFATVVPSEASTHWYPADAGWVSHADGGEIGRIVGAKAAKVDQYRKRCEEVSLLIVFEGTPHSARAVHAPEGLVSFSVSTRFDRVYCLDVLERRLVEIPVEVHAG